MKMDFEIVVCISVYIRVFTRVMLCKHGLCYRLVSVCHWLSIVSKQIKIPSNFFLALWPRHYDFLMPHMVANF